MNRRLSTYSAVTVAMMAVFTFAACSKEQKKADEEFHTSGSREADQRAEQRMARDQQIRGEEKTPDQSLYSRLGGAQGLEAIVDDFLDRALADPRVNWRRRGVTSGGFLNIGDRSVEWKATPEEIAQLRKRMVDFLALATGGPSEYRGRSMQQIHDGMEISNPEFDATIGDMKATLDALKVPATEQKELLAILESTRPQVVEKR